jgi:hypothetical protein
MESIQSRSVTQAEIAVMRSALERAPIDSAVRKLEYRLDNLVAVGRCACGCASVYFQGYNEGQNAHRVAEGSGLSPDGEVIGVLLWALDSKIVHLEIVGFSDTPAPLPLPESIEN